MRRGGICLKRSRISSPRAKLDAPSGGLVVRDARLYRAPHHVSSAVKAKPLRLMAAISAATSSLPIKKNIAVTAGLLGTKTANAKLS
jgi:hypothetical protein